MEKVIEPDIEETWQCRRCLYYHCGTCISSCEVDFEIEDKPEGFNQDMIQWKGECVCPWCYNQLVDIFKKRVR